MTTSISWATHVWNPILGCTQVSEGCDRCYAMRFVHRGLVKEHRGLTRMTGKGVKWNGRVRVVHSRLLEPLSWRKPRRVFVNSLSDLFHEKLDTVDVARIFAVMALARRHVFIVLTKRPDRMARMLASRSFWWEVATSIRNFGDGEDAQELARYARAEQRLANVWLGTSVENQSTAEERLHHLVRTRAAVRVVSAEPLLGPVKFDPWLGERAGAMWRTADGHLTDGPPIGWLLMGGESGAGARPCHLRWLRDVRDEAVGRSALWMKQLGATSVWPADLWTAAGERPLGVAPSPDDDAGTVTLRMGKKGEDPTYWPTDLQVRELPHAA